MKRPRGRTAVTRGSWSNEELVKDGSNDWSTEERVRELVKVQRFVAKRGHARRPVQRGTGQTIELIKRGGGTGHREEGVPFDSEVVKRRNGQKAKWRGPAMGGMSPIHRDWPRQRGACSVTA